jgi:hypothetical protein
MRSRHIHVPRKCGLQVTPAIYPFSTPPSPRPGQNHVTWNMGAGGSTKRLRGKHQFVEGICALFRLSGEIP